MTIKLDLRTDLIKVIPTTLGDRNGCRYSAPCAIGAMMTPDQRQQLVGKGKDTIAIEFLIDDRHVEVPADQRDDFERLQSAFDHGTRERFDLVLAELKEKYTL